MWIAFILETVQNQFIICNLYNVTMPQYDCNLPPPPQRPRLGSTIARAACGSIVLPEQNYLKKTKKKKKQSKKTKKQKTKREQQQRDMFLCVSTRVCMVALGHSCKLYLNRPTQGADSDQHTPGPQRWRQNNDLYWPRSQSPGPQRWRQNNELYCPRSQSPSTHVTSRMTGGIDWRFLCVLVLFVCFC